MDPQALWDGIKELIAEYWQYKGSDRTHIREDLTESLRDLAEWIDKGGLVPKV